MVADVDEWKGRLVLVDGVVLGDDFVLEVVEKAVGDEEATVGEGDGRDEAPEELGEQVFGPEDVRYALER